MCHLNFETSTNEFGTCMSAACFAISILKNKSKYIKNISLIDNLNDYKILIREQLQTKNIFSVASQNRQCSYSLGGKKLLQDRNVIKSLLVTANNVLEYIKCIN